MFILAFICNDTQTIPMTNTDSILKSRDITLLTEVRIVKANKFSISPSLCTWTLWTMKVKVSVPQSCLTAIPWTVAHQASLSMKFSRQEYWSGFVFFILLKNPNPNPFPSAEDLPNPGIKPMSPALQVGYLPTEPPDKTVNYEIFLIGKVAWRKGGLSL